MENDNAKAIKQRSKVRCSKCNSSFIYYRITTQERVCRQCGHAEKVK